MHTEFVIPKRMDEIDERWLLTGVGLEREIRSEKSIDISPWIKKGYNQIEIGKIGLYDKFTYACAIYITK